MDQATVAPASWEAITHDPFFASCVEQVQLALDGMRASRRPLTLLAFCAVPDAADRLSDRLLEGYRDQTHTAIANCLRLMGRESDRCTAPFSVVIGAVCFIAVPACDLRKGDRDLMEILESVARAPWTHPRGIVPRRLRIGVAAWDPTMASADGRLLMGRAFEALVMASFGVTDAWPTALPVHPHDQARLAVSAWQPARRRPAAPVTPQVSAPAEQSSVPARRPAASPAATRPLRREKNRGAKVAPRPWWKVW